MSTPIFHDCIQGSAEWHALRCGMLTASTLKVMITPTGKIADNATTRAYLADILAQRLTKYTEPSFVSDDMQRGIEDEYRARDVYAAKYHVVEQVGFITRQIAPGVTIGCSPDGLVGTGGGIEIKSRRAKLQIQQILDGTVPDEHLAQIHTAMLVTGRQWWDFISYSAGLPMVVIRVPCSYDWMTRITTAAVEAERRIAEMRAQYDDAVLSNDWPETERMVQEIVIT
jgi:hypothetical protein